MSSVTPVGFLPAAGRGVRFGASGYAKELFPLLFDGPEHATLEPRPICQLALAALQKTGAARCVTVISPEKLEVVRVLGAHENGMALAYVVQPHTGGIPHALTCARPWLDGADVVFAMPDTIFLPGDALERAHAERIATGADVMLAVFPTDEAERLGPVVLDANGAIVRIEDKPARAEQRNTWGAASWSPRFTAFCCDWEAKRANDATQPNAREGAMGHVFEAARTSGLDVRAIAFPSGSFFDIGTPHGLRAALTALVARGVLFPDQATAVHGE